MRWGSVIRGAPFVVYPLIVYLALEYVEAKYLGLALLVVLALRHRGRVREFTAGMTRSGWAAVTLMAVFAAAVWWFNDETLLRLYPVLLNLMGLTAFALTLRYPPSMIERFARMRSPTLPPAAVRYTARVTAVWCGFFLLNATAAAYTAFYASREIWALYNGLIAYGLVGALLLGEWLVRRHFVEREPV